MILIDGKKIAAELREELRQEVVELKAKHNKIPGLTVILIGDMAPSQIYVRMKEKAANEVGLKSEVIRYPEAVEEKTVLDKIEELNKDESISGILVQLPLPKHIDKQKVIETILPGKDVDGFHPMNVGNLSSGYESSVPCTPLGCYLMIKKIEPNLSGKKAVMIGRSNLNGKPMAQLLLKENCTVTITHSRTKDLKAECLEADIIVAAVGIPELVKADWVKKDAIVIDVGINKTENGIVGDVAFEEVSKVARALTPVPGGVGPMTEDYIAWIGHATYLIKLGDTTIITDPVFSKNAGPLIFGPDRFTEPALNLNEIPKTDVILVTHNHYDHQDMGTIRRYPFKDTKVLTPLNLGKYFTKNKFKDVNEMDWYEEIKVNRDLKVTLLPAVHWSKRSLTDMNKTLWGNFLIEYKGKKILFACDTGYGNIYKELGEKYGPIDLTMINIGAYDFKPMFDKSIYHTTPEEALNVAKDLRSKKVMGTHWGTFVLSLEPIMEPPVRFKASAEKYGFKKEDAIIFKIGEINSLKNILSN